MQYHIIVLSGSITLLSGYDLVIQNHTLENRQKKKTHISRAPLPTDFVS